MKKAVSIMCNLVQIFVLYILLLILDVCESLFSWVTGIMKHEDREWFDSMTNMIEKLEPGESIDFGTITRNDGARTGYQASPKDRDTADHAWYRKAY